jgi:hypothetical protein
VAMLRGSGTFNKDLVQGIRSLVVTLSRD